MLEVISVDISIALVWMMITSCVSIYLSSRQAMVITCSSFVVLYGNREVNGSTLSDSRGPIAGAKGSRIAVVCTCGKGGGAAIALCGRSLFSSVRNEIRL